MLLTFSYLTKFLLYVLGTKLDTKIDITSRKAKVWDPIKKFKRYFTSKRLSIGHKIRVFKTYIEPILLYNSETWIMTKTLEENIDAFHRRLLRIAINKQYPKTISCKIYTHLPNKHKSVKEFEKMPYPSRTHPTISS